MVDKDDCIIIDHIELLGKSYIFKPEIVLFLQTEDSVSGKPPLLTVEAPRLEILAFARTKNKLLHEINEQIKFLIEEYVLADDKNFSPGALQLRKRWLKIIKD
jgi:hypothetical protein